MKRVLAAAFVALLLPGCGRDLTAPGNPAPVQLSIDDASTARRATFLDGNAVTLTVDDGTTISVDRVAHTMTVDGYTLILTQEAADSLHGIITRMYVTEQQLLYIQTNGVEGSGLPGRAIGGDPGGGLDPDDPGCSDDALICGGNLSSVGSGGTAASQPPLVDVAAIDLGAQPLLRPANAAHSYTVGGRRIWTSFGAELAGEESMTVTSSSPASYLVGYDPGFTCGDISLAIYNETPAFRTAKANLGLALKAQSANLMGYAKNLPQLPTDPTTWFGWARLWMAAPALDLAYANLEHSRMKLNLFATWFHANSCTYNTPDTPAPTPTQPGGDGGGGGEPPPNASDDPVEMTCWYRVTYWLTTGEIISIQPLGCG